MVAVAESDVRNPAKLIRILNSGLALLHAWPEEPLDRGARDRLERMWTGVMVELGSTLSSDSLHELRRLMPAVEGRLATDDELRLTQAQVVGWLQGVVAAELTEGKMNAEARKASAASAPGESPGYL